MSWSTVLLAAAGTGIAGWVLENVAFGPRYSAHLPGVPFLPVYAVGGATIALLAPHLSAMDPAGRALIYAGTLTGVEALAGYVERAQGRKSWDYGGSPVDLPHAALWGGLGLLAESMIR